MEMLNERISTRNLAMKRSALLLTILLLVTLVPYSGLSIRIRKHRRFRYTKPQSPKGNAAGFERYRFDPLPPGYKRIPVDSGSFGGFLRSIRLRKNNTFYLYNGQPKLQQDLHYAVLDISTGNKDLQQCADAIMRLRAEYFCSQAIRQHLLPGQRCQNLPLRRLRPISWRVP